MHKQSWSIVVFCYNEAGTVADVIDRLLKLLDAQRNSLYEIIVVDDGSVDGSAEKVDAAKKARPDVIQAIRHEKNLGIGYALRSGYSAAKNENVIAIPADGQFNEQELLPYLDFDERSFVSFYRRETQYTRFRTILSAINRYVNRHFNGISLKDVNWAKAYKRKAVVTFFPLQMTSALIESEICAKLLLSGNSAVEVLSVYHPRLSGKSKGASLKIIFQAFCETLRLILVMRQFQYEKSH